MAREGKGRIETSPMKKNFQQFKKCLHLHTARTRSSFEWFGRAGQALQTARYFARESNVGKNTSQSQESSVNSGKIKANLIFDVLDQMGKCPLIASRLPSRITCSSHSQARPGQDHRNTRSMKIRLVLFCSASQSSALSEAHEQARMLTQGHQSRRWWASSGSGRHRWRNQWPQGP